ncbi:MAG: hypothetical protein JNG84_11390, partial [Archangium sp.]|nr:hypothetical protein [Archangium sp.]
MSGATKPYIGGQAVIEGVMMRSPQSFVVAVRTPEGKVAIREQQWRTLLPSLKFLRWPLFRGAVVLAESLHNGYSALKFSADHGLPPEEGGLATKPPLASTLSFLMSAVAAGAESPPPAASPSPGQPKTDAAANAMLAMATVFMVGV